MARILTPEQFRLCERGTLFAFGAGDMDLRRELLILDEIIPMRDGSYGGPPFWGFWAIDPLQTLFACAEGTEDQIQAARQSGRTLAFEPDRYWNYEDAMDVFLVFDKPDLLGLARLLGGADWETLSIPAEAV